MLSDGDHFSLSEAIQHLSVLVQQETGFGTPQSDGGSTKNEWIRDNPIVHSTNKRLKIPSFALAECGLDEFDSKTKRRNQRTMKRSAASVVSSWTSTIYAITATWSGNKSLPSETSATSPHRSSPTWLFKC